MRHFRRTRCASRWKVLRATSGSSVTAPSPKPSTPSSPPPMTSPWCSIHQERQPGRRSVPSPNEASHQMATNPLPPGVRKPGAVGLGAGVEIAIMDDVGNLMPEGERGEVVIKGGNVTAGYANNPTANAGAFTNGWFRTGDQGMQDGDGYLWLTGRLKEIINRGGEKLSPREIDEALLAHPAVAQP